MLIYNDNFWWKLEALICPCMNLLMTLSLLQTLLSIFMRNISKQKTVQYENKNEQHHETIVFFTNNECNNKRWECNRTTIIHFMLFVLSFFKALYLFIIPYACCNLKVNYLWNYNMYIIFQTHLMQSFSKHDFISILKADL